MVPVEYMERISIEDAHSCGIGTVLARRIPRLNAYHVAIVVAERPVLLAEHDYDGQRIVTLEEFLYGQPTIWRMTFAYEMANQGPNCFRTPIERAKTAMRLLKEAKPYCVHLYNCEHFVRKCTFCDPRLWSSPQVVGPLKSQNNTDFLGHLLYILNPLPSELG